MILQPFGGGSGVKIAAGSYVGNGDYGESSPTIIDIGFEPKMFFVIRDGKVSIDTLGSGIVYLGQSITDIHATMSDGIFSMWYSNAGGQLNLQGTTYFWFALG